MQLSSRDCTFCSSVGRAKSFAGHSAVSAAQIGQTGVELIWRLVTPASQAPKPNNGTSRPNAAEPPPSTAEIRPGQQGIHQTAPGASVSFENSIITACLVLLSPKHNRTTKLVVNTYTDIVLYLHREHTILLRTEPH